MSWRTHRLAALSLLALALMPAWAAGEDADGAFPAILSPQDGAKVPRHGEDPPCPPEGPCTDLYVKGRVPEGLRPFVAVAPLSAAPRIWIQAAVTLVRRDGTFDAKAVVGTETAGAGERFQIFVFGCEARHRFEEGQILNGVPDDCQVSDPVTVLRTR